MTEPLPIVMVPGLIATPRLYAEQIPIVWRFGPVTVADHTRDDSMDAIARRILAAAPPRFALLGLSMGGYIAFAILREARDRVVKLALLDTSARPDAPEQTQGRLAHIDMAKTGRLAEITDLLFPKLVHRSHQNDTRLRDLVRLMAQETGPEAFIRQQHANLRRPDSRPGLAAIHCPTLVLVGDGDELIPPDRSEEIANGIRGARFITIKDAGHLTTLEQPEAVTAAVVDWLAE